jgi:hypothetical protein
VVHEEVSLMASETDTDNNEAKGSLCLRFFDAGLSAAFRLVATVARVGKHD